jgi:hypothetical protein
MLAAQVFDGRGGGGIASHHQGLNAAPAQVLGDAAGAGEHMVGLALAVRPVAAVGQVDEVLLGQFTPQGLQDAQAADAAVVDADHRCCAMGVIRLRPRPPGWT